MQSRRPSKPAAPAQRNDLLILIGIAAVRFLLHIILNNRYDFHRDELAMIDYARTIDWGFVEFPPLAPVFTSLSMGFFGESARGARVFSALAQSVIVVLAGLMARDFGGKRFAQIVAAVAFAISIFSLLMGSMTQYTSFEMLWWAAASWALVRLLRTNDLRWWLAVGAFLGLGMLTKYTVAVAAFSIAIATLATARRADLRTRWPWLGAALACLIFAPNLIWQARHAFIGIEFTSTIHARDIALGRTAGFLPEQLYVNINPVTVPLAIAGFVWLCRRPRFRMLAWLFALAFVTFLVVQARAYYVAGAYPVLLAAGAVAWEEQLQRWAQSGRRIAVAATVALLALGGVAGAALGLPIAPVNSALWRVTADTHDVFREQIGWQQQVRHIAQHYMALPPRTRLQTAIVAANYGEAGAINRYGAQYGLPQVVSGINSYWLRGYGARPWTHVLAVGFNEDWVQSYFSECELLEEFANEEGVENEESTLHRRIWYCARTNAPWQEMWPNMAWFG